MTATELEYSTRCPVCGGKANLIKDSTGLIRCKVCGEPIGTEISADLIVTVLCGWNGPTREPIMQEVAA